MLNILILRLEHYFDVENVYSLSSRKGSRKNLHIRYNWLTNFNSCERSKIKYVGTGIYQDYPISETNANGDLVVYSTGTNNELTSDGAYTYAYDAEGNRISKTNAAGTERELYSWDYRNRLSSVTKQTYDSVTQEWETVQVVEYAYDYNNVLIRKVLDANGDGTADSKTLFLPENYQTAIQLDDADLSDSTYETVSHRYLWTPGQQDKLLADVTPTETLWTLTDHLGTVRDIIQNTPSGLIVPAHVIYDAYGNVLSCKDPNGTDVSNPVLFGFTGKYFDSDTQLQNNVNRWYDSTTGRWLSTDPIGFNGNDTNLYRYVGNRVIINIDQMGLQQGWSYSANTPMKMPWDNPKPIKPNLKPLPKPQPSGTKEDLILMKYNDIKKSKEYPITGGKIIVEGYLRNTPHFVSIKISYKPNKNENVCADVIRFVQIVKSGMNKDKNHNKWVLDGAGKNQSDNNVLDPYWKQNGLPGDWYDPNSKREKEFPSNGLNNDVYYMIDQPGRSLLDSTYNAEFYTGVVCNSCKGNKLLGYIHWRLTENYSWGRSYFTLSILDSGVSKISDNGEKFIPKEFDKALAPYPFIIKPY